MRPSGATAAQSTRPSQLKVQISAPVSIEWRRDGLRPPPAVLVTTDEYREEMDLLGRFIEERCVLRQDLMYRATPLYQAYRAWCEESGESWMRQTAFGLRLAERGLVKVKQGTIHYKGIALRKDP